MVNHELLDLIKEKVNSIEKETILIGIDGGQGSGKSTLVEEVKKYLQQNTEYNILQIETDDFLIERDKREDLPVSFFQQAKNLSYLFNFKQMSAVLQTLIDSKDQVVTIGDLYNAINGKKDRSASYLLNRKNVIIVGGPYLLAPEMPVLDYKIFIFVTKKNRLLNALKRTVDQKKDLHRQKELFAKFENFYVPYFQEMLPSYDLFVDNNDFNKMEIISMPDISI